MEKIKCAAIVITYNGKKEWYDKCFTSLETSSVALEIIVVDNNSSDDSVAYISKKFPQIKIIQNDENLGFAKANNIGLNDALKNDNNYFFLLNQDAWVEQNTIEVLIETAEKNSNFGVLTPIHLTADKNSFDHGFRNSFNKCSDTAFAFENLYLNKQPTLYETREVAAAAWLITKKCIEIVGGFDTILFKTYGEDNNYAQRLAYHKLKIGIVPAVTMCHDREFRTIKKWDRNIGYAIVLGNILTTKKQFFIYFLKTFFKYRQIIFIAKNFRKILKSRKINKRQGGSMEYISHCD